MQDAFLRRTEELDWRLGVGRSFDMVGRSLTIGGRRARLWVVNGYADDAVLERAVAGWLLSLIYLFFSRFFVFIFRNSFRFCDVNDQSIFWCNKRDFAVSS